MNQRVNQEWNPSEVEGARSIIDFLNNYYNNDGTNHDKNKKHAIVANLQGRFPRKTMQQVTSLYDDLVVEMNILKCPEKEYDGTNSFHGVNYTVDGLMNKNFGLQEEVDMEGMDLLFGHPLETMPTMEIQEQVSIVEENKVELENKMCIHQPVIAAHAKGYWTTEEHRLFLRGLHVCGRGKWKDISKYFVTSRTPAQISSHAQKYFMKLQKEGSGIQRYSINNVELDAADPWKMDNSFNFWQALALQSTIGASDQNPTLDV
ncbi:hypothetical protein ZWY2020_050569 [Hordeum vulgare]|nr:hypothetical protein ZWY2020_050569 [Hordeum vulgare]